MNAEEFNASSNAEAPDSDWKLVYTFLKNDVSWLHALAKTYRQLFGTNQRRIELLDECAAQAFYIFQVCLFDSIVLAIVRLGDPPKSHANENASLPRLLLLLRKKMSSSLPQDLDILEQRTRSSCAALKNHRNKWIAHRDLSHTSKGCWLGTPQEFGLDDIDDALSAIRQLLNRIEQTCIGAIVLYEHTIIPADAEELLCSLKQAAAFEDLEKEGKIDPALWTEGRFMDA